MKHLLITVLTLASLSTFAASEECEQYIDEFGVAAYDLATSVQLVKINRAAGTTPEKMEALLEMRKTSAENVAAMRKKASEVCK